MVELGSRISLIMIFKWLIKLKQLVWRSKKFVYVAIGDSTVEGIGATDSSKSYRCGQPEQLIDSLIILCYTSAIKNYYYLGNYE